MPRAFTTVDVFTRQPLLGNPVTVILNAEGLTGEEMQRIARWTNLSETTFLLAPTVDGADYRLRIFTPAGELPFAGHPTLGSAHAALQAGRVTPTHGQVVQECAQGLVPIAVQADPSGVRLDLTMPPARILPLSAPDRQELEALLNAPVNPDAALVNVGPTWLIARLDDPQALLKLAPDAARETALERRLGLTGLTLYAPTGDGANIEVRSFAAGDGIPEDPVCGSGNGAAAYHRQAFEHLTGPYLATQGRCLHRDGQVHVNVTHGPTVTIGGHCVTVETGTLNA